MNRFLKAKIVKVAKAAIAKGKTGVNSGIGGADDEDVGLRVGARVGDGECKTV